MNTPIAAVASLLLAAQVAAQCTNQWLPFGPGPGVGTSPFATLAWDPDGPGPLAERIVVGGSFTSAGNVTANHVASFDPATGTWSPLGSGMDNFVAAFTVLPNHDLVAAGNFGVAGGQVAARIARWNGSTWAPIGGGLVFAGSVTSLAVLPNGDLIAGKMEPGGVVHWNGSTWGVFGGTSAPRYVNTVLALPNGEVFAGGLSLARWNGSTWTSIPGLAGSNGQGGTQVHALATMPNGDLVVGGNFLTAGGVAVNHIARWDGATWTALGAGATGTGYASVRTLRVLANGDLLVGGRFDSIGGIAAASIARWDGSAWSSLGAGVRYAADASATVLSLTPLASGDLVVGGQFSVAGSIAAENVARWNGAQWLPLSSGPGVATVQALAPDDGGFVAVGSFEAIGNQILRGVARWNGSAWSALGGGGTAGGFPRTCVRLPGGDLAIGGTFTSVGGVNANGVARWNGTQWSAVGALWSTSDVGALVATANGGLVSGGALVLPGGVATSVAAWNGAAWAPLGAGLPGRVRALAVHPNGLVLAGGDFAGRVAQWNGSQWALLGTGLPASTQAAVALAVMPNGDVVAAANRYYLYRWDGAEWSAHVTTMVELRALHVLPDGDLLVGSADSSGVYQTRGMLRWDGTTFRAVAGGLDGPVSALASTPTGEILVGGTFRRAGGSISAGIATLTTTCPTSVLVAGAGCGGDTVTASLPWTGSTWRATASGLPNTALVAAVTGFATTSLPLAGLVPTALPGCTLHVAPEAVVSIPGANGAATLQFGLPDTPSLVGVVFHHQMVSLALDGTLAVTVTNALRLQIGAF